MLDMHVTVFHFIKVIAGFLILYIFLPSRIISFDKHGNEWLDKIFISMTHAHFGIIIIVHLLVAVRIYETISLAIALIIFFITYYNMRNRRSVADSEEEERKSALGVLLDLADGRLGWFGNFINSAKNFIKSIPSRIRNLIIYSVAHPFDGILIFAVFVLAFWLRFRHAFEHLYFGASDAYVHLAWTKYLGINKIYLDGVYPYGYEAVLSALHKLFFIDPAILIRFFGGIGSSFILFSIYYVLKKNLKNQFVLIFAAVFAFAFGTEFPNAASNLWRQLSALPQEYATIFLLPGIHFLNVFYNTGRKKYLLLAAEILAITVFIHFYTAIFVAVGYIFVSLMHIRKVFYKKTFWQVLSYMTGGGVIGILPIIIGRLAGIDFHAMSYGYVTESAAVSNTLDWTKEIFRFAEYDRTLLLLLASAAIIVLAAILRLIFSREPEYTGRIKLFLAIALLNLFIYTQIRSPEVGYPSLMEAYRASTFLGVIIVTLYAMMVGTIEFFPIHKAVRYVIKLAGAALIIIVSFSVSNMGLLFPQGAKLEYDAAAYNYYKIKEEYPTLNWTIISPVEQYSQSMGYGWHYNLWEFVKDTQVEPKEEFEFPTDYVFIFVEKRPLNQSDPYRLTDEVTLHDYNQPFPEVGDVSDRYYTNYTNRRIVEAKAYFWIEENLLGEGYFDVFYEDEHMKIYILEQDGTKPLNLAK